MSTKKYFFSLICIGTIFMQFPVFADDISDMKTNVTDMIAKLMQKYEARIQELETENSKLKQEIVSLKSIVPVVSVPAKDIPVVTAPASTPTAPTITSTTPKSDIYNAVIKQTNASLSTILSENNLPGYTAIGLFEFMEPNAFFISLDDGNNPTGVTAFKTKILYTFNNNLTFTKIGMFDLDYTSQRYRTLFGSNPYVTAARTRIQNPNYKGKLFETPAPTNNPVSTPAKTTTSTTESTTVGGSDVTLAQIKTAYDKTKLLDALKLSDIYIIKNPNDLEVLRIRYRSYYIIGKYENSLAEIKKIEALQGTAFERTIACDAAVIGKIAKKTDVSTYYSTICKKK